MNGSNHIDIFKELKKYIEHPENTYKIDNNKIQLHSIAQPDNDYFSYLLNTKNKYHNLLAFLHGAIYSESPVREYEDSFIDYQTKDLKLLWGMYGFIDPLEKNSDKATPYYLLGAMSGLENSLKPSFTFKLFTNINNLRGNAEFTPYPDEWLSFYLDLNTFLRSNIKFSEDYPSYFSKRSGHKRNEIEENGNFLYVSSGEIDHGILQWLFFVLKDQLKTSSNDYLNVSIKIDLDGIDKNLTKIDEHFKEKHKSVIEEIRIIDKDNKKWLSKDKCSEFKFRKWLIYFGLLKDNELPTERLIASIEFFYFHLKHTLEGYNDKKNKSKYYFSIGKGDNESLFYKKDVCNESCTKFLEECEKLLPVTHDYAKTLKEISGLDRKKEILSLLNSYFDTISLFASYYSAIDAFKFKEYCRFPVVSYFFQRFSIGLYNSLWIEQTCKGLINFPILSNTEDTKKSEIPFIGYFMGLIKDSDSKGRCYFNWRTHSNEESKSSTTDFFYNDYLFYLQNFGFTLGRIEVQHIYYKGIVEKHRKETIEEAIRAAISQVMARNMSHNIGSHVMNNLVSDLDTINLDVEGPYKSDQNIKSINPKLKTELNKVLPGTKNAESKIQHLKSRIIFDQLAIYNNYVKCRMDYLSDITFSTPVMQTNKKVKKELFYNLDKVRLLLDNISGLANNFPYKINFIAGKEVDDDLTVAMPNDLLGCQAFYNIIENVIRNTAKHNQGKRNVNSTITTTNFYIDFKDISENEDVEEKNLWYQVEIYDDIHVQDIEKLVKAQNDKINLNILDDNKQLRNSSLGLLEMEASAAYLRKLDIINIESPVYKVDINNDKSIHTNKILNILKAFSKEIDGKHYLGYRFFVSKPMEYLFVGNYEITKDKQRVEVLLKMGIWFIPENYFKRELEKENGTVYNHQYIFYNGNTEIKELIRIHRTSLPMRIVKINEQHKELLELLKEKDFNLIEKCVWKIWFDEIKANYECVNVTGNYDPEIQNCVKQYNIVLLDHEDMWDKNLKYKREGTLQYLEPLSSAAQKTLPNFINSLENYINGIENKSEDIYKLFEASVSKVLIIDERIQRFSNFNANLNDTPSNKCIFRFTNITVPSKSYPLDPENFDQDQVKLICQYIDQKIKSSDFLLIHYSILERMFNNKDPNDTTKNDPRINEYLIKWAELAKRVIVTSGRGKPKDLAKEVCYVNLSPVLNVFTQTRSKYSINYLLNQARK